jgi:hypothetical protein
MTDKWQTLPLVREGAPYGQDCNFQWKINIWSWAPDGARHQDGLTDCQSQSDSDSDYRRVKVRVILRLAVYLKSVRLGAKLLEVHDQRHFFLQVNPCGHSPYVTSSLTRGWVCLLWIGFASPLSSVCIAHIENSSLCIIYKCRLCKADHV